MNNDSRIANTGREMVVIPPPAHLGFKIEMAKEFARRNTTNPVWWAFKAKWDGRQTPRRGTKAFAEFQAEATAAQASCQQLFDAVRAEAA